MAETKIRSPKATTLLKEDHRNVRKLYTEYVGRGARKAALFERIRSELEIHALIEEEIFYPAIELADEDEAGRLVREAHEEHRIVRQLLRECAALTPGGDDFDAKFKVLMDHALHHADEEQSRIFPIFDRLPRDDREEVAERLQARRRELAAGG